MRKYSMARGTTANIVQGVVIRIAKRTETVFKDDYQPLMRSLHTLSTEIKRLWSADGTVESTVDRSLENRFKIRPSGVVSKNDMGERMTRCSIVLW